LPQAESDSDLFLHRRLRQTEIVMFRVWHLGYGLALVENRVTASEDASTFAILNITIYSD
jgi:hypothetical protein